MRRPWALFPESFRCASRSLPRYNTWNIHWFKFGEGYNNGTPYTFNILVSKAPALARGASPRDGSMCCRWRVVECGRTSCTRSRDTSPSGASASGEPVVARRACCAAAQCAVAQPQQQRCKHWDERRWCGGKCAQQRCGERSITYSHHHKRADCNGRADRTGDADCHAECHCIGVPGAARCRSANTGSVSTTDLHAGAYRGGACATRTSTTSAGCSGASCTGPGTTCASTARASTARACATCTCATSACATRTR